MVEPDVIVAKIKESISGSEVEVRDLTGTKDHYELTVVSPEFEGKPLIRRHRLVYEALSEEMEGPIHALQLETKTPDEV